MHECNIMWQISKYLVVIDVLNSFTDLAFKQKIIMFVRYYVEAIKMLIINCAYVPFFLISYFLWA